MVSSGDFSTAPNNRRKAYIPPNQRAGSSRTEAPAGKRCSAPDLDELFSTGGAEAVADEISDMSVTAENCRRLLEYSAGYDDINAYTALLTHFDSFLTDAEKSSLRERAQSIFEPGVIPD